MAVSSNFYSVFQTLTPELEAHCNCKISTTSGASGVLASQFANGAPYDVFLSADSAKPQWLYTEGKTQSEPRTYAMGQLVLLDSSRDRIALTDLGVSPTEEGKKNGAFRIAIANAKTAPYGKAAEQVIEAVGMPQSAQIVRGNNVLQALQYFKTGNVAQAIVARSLVSQIQHEDSAIYSIPNTLHSPIEQQAVINRSTTMIEASMVIEFLLKPTTQKVLTQWGYSPLTGGENDAG